MSEQIKKSDIFEGDPFKDIKDTLELSMTVLTKYDEKLRNTAKSFIDIASSTKTATADLAKLIEVEKQSNVIANEKKRNQKDISAIEKERENLKKNEERLQARLNTLNSKEAENVAKLRAQITEQNKQMRQKLQVQRELTAEEEKNLGTLEKLNIANAKLRAERQNLDLETQKGRDRLVQINAELDKNNEFIKANSDQLAAQKMNVGNYTDSVKDALNQSGLFSRQLNQLNRIQNTLNAILKKNTADTTAQAAAQSTATATTGGLSKALKVLRVALISTGIGAIVVVLGSLIAYLTSTQEGMDKVNKVLYPLTEIFKEFLGILQELGGSTFRIVVAGFQNVVNAFILGGQKIMSAILNMRIAWNEWTGDTEEANELKATLNEVEKTIKETTENMAKNSKIIADAWEDIKDTVDGAGDRFSEAEIRAQKILDLTIAIREQNIKNTVPIAKNNLLYRQQQEIIGDTSKTEAERNAAIIKARAAIEDSMNREMELERQNLILLKLKAEANDTNAEDRLAIAEQEAKIFEKNAEYQRKLNTLARAEGTIRNEVRKQMQERLKVMNDIVDIEQQVAIEREQRRLKELQDEGVHFSELLEQRRKIAQMEIKLEQDRFERLKKVSDWSRKDEELERAKLNQKLMQMGWEFEDEQREIIENRIKPIQKSNEEIIAEEFEALEKLSEQRKLINLNTIQDDEQFKAAELQRELDLIDAKIEALKKYDGTEDEITQLRIKRAEMTRGKVEDVEKQTVQVIVNAQNQIAQAYERAAQRKIKALQDEQKAAEDQISALKESAKEGAILDKDSIKDAEKRRREAIREQKRIEKQQQRVQFIQLALQNVTNQLKNGKSTGEALGSTFALQSALKTLFAGFEGFYKGTDNAPQGFAWVDEKGAEIHTDKHGNIKDLGSDGGARLKFLEQGDKIIPHEKSMELLNSSLPIVKEKPSVKIDPTLDLLREQNRLLKNVTESKMTAEQIGSILHLTTEDKRGNLSRINRYKYKR